MIVITHMRGSTRTGLHHLNGTAREAECHGPHGALAEVVNHLVYFRHDELCGHARQA